MRLQGTWAALSAFAWQPAPALLVTALAVRVRERTLGVLTAAYSTISAPRAASFLGLPEADAVAREPTISSVTRPLFFENPAVVIQHHLRAARRLLPEPGRRQTPSHVSRVLHA